MVFVSCFNKGSHLLYMHLTLLRMIVWRSRQEWLLRLAPLQQPDGPQQTHHETHHECAHLNDNPSFAADMNGSMNGTMEIEDGLISLNLYIWCVDLDLNSRKHYQYCALHMFLKLICLYYRCIENCTNSSDSKRCEWACEFLWVCSVIHAILITLLFSGG